MKITEEEIKRISSATIYRRGLEYYREGRVHLRVRDEHEIVSVVDGEEIYNVGIHFDDAGHVTDSFCTCPYFRTMDCTCKHIVATLKVRQKELEEGAGYADENDRLAKLICKKYDSETAIKKHMNLAVNVRINDTPAGLKYSAQLLAGEQYPEQIAGAEAFLAAYSGNREYKLSKFRSFTRDKYEFGETESKILDILAENCQNKTAAGVYTQKLASTDFGAMTMKRLMPYLVKAHAEFVINDIKLCDWQVRYEDPEILIDVNAADGLISVCVPESGTAIVPDGSWFLFGGDIYNTTEEWRRDFMPIYNVLCGGARTQIDFSGENSIAFAAKILPRLRGKKSVVMQGIDELVVDTKPHFEVYFDCRGEGISAVIAAVYGNIRLRLPKEDAGQNKIIIRDVEAENEVMRRFGQFYIKDGCYLLDDSDMLYRFLFEELPELEKTAEVIESDSFAALRRKTAPDISAQVSYNKDIDLLEVSFESNLSAEEIDGILAAIKLRKSYYRTKGGKFVALDDKEGLAGLLNHMDFGREDIKKGKKAVSKYHALYLAGLSGSGRIGSDEKFDALMEEVRAIRADIPDEINAVLRDYQRDGVNWLAQLDELGFGGILADDMGLGKTLEVIAFVMSKRSDRPALVVAPSALLYNWQKEIARFAPAARTLIADGTKPERAQKLESAAEYDFVITSYPLLRRDGALYRGLNFSSCFIDEAQYIKNPKTMNARGVKTINAERRFALTGTPIENSLTELWSIFDFIMPGYLGTHRSFAERYEKPVSQGMEGAAEVLRARIKPFVMRRMKNDVLTELPEKLENTVFAELAPEQKRLYAAYLSTARSEADRILSEGRGGIAILSLITRLRQICCHPVLFDENYNKESGKLELLCELVSSALAGGHRLLVFSQFTSMLKIIRSALEERGTSCFYLDGSTPPYERSELASRFNGGEKDVFLISLKAGGTGLNLIGADMVIHYDPWWNPAVTDQASDRAYRIGQTKAVQVIRLAASGTIEEQILKLQDKKRALADGVIIKNSAVLSNLTNEEIMSLFE